MTKTLIAADVEGPVALNITLPAEGEWRISRCLINGRRVRGTDIPHEGEMVFLEGFDSPRGRRIERISVEIERE